jgi:hypothetical protein
VVSGAGTGELTMRKILAIAALAGGLMIPLATPSAAVTVGPPCDHMSMEAAMCGMDYDVDMSICDLSPPGEVSACQGRALGKWARCMTTC